MTTAAAEARTITTGMAREAVRSFCKGGGRVSNAQLYEVMGLACEPEKDRLRTRINGMVDQGEVNRIGPDLYEYNFKFRLRKNETYPRLWRFVRTQKPGWSVNAACQLTRVSYTQAMRYIAWLEGAGFVARHGKDGQTTLYRATDKADKTPETPFPPITDRNPFEKEAAAAAQIARLMLCHDPYQPKTARDIVAACNVLLARFNKSGQEAEGETA